MAVGCPSHSNDRRFPIHQAEALWGMESLEESPVRNEGVPPIHSPLDTLPAAAVRYIGDPALRAHHRLQLPITHELPPFTSPHCSPYPHCLCFDDSRQCWRWATPSPQLRLFPQHNLVSSNPSFALVTPHPSHPSLNPMSLSISPRLFLHLHPLPTPTRTSPYPLFPLAALPSQ